MSCSTVFLYAGQGTQYFHMGSDLYDASPAFREVLERSEVRFREIHGHSLLDAMFDPSVGRRDAFDQTCVTHPALVAVQIGLSHMLAAAGVKPDQVVGYSVGEVAAASMAGVLTVEDAVEFAARQAELLEATCSPGGMMAILASPSLMEEEPALFSGCELAAHNLPAHFVVAGSRGCLARLRVTLVERGIAAQILPVSQAFHSSSMEPARAGMTAIASGLDWRSATLPVFSATLAATVASPWPEHLWRVARDPVRFQLSVEHLEATGPHIYVDLGPSATLANFLKYALPATSRSTVLASLRRAEGEQQHMNELIEKLDNLNAGSGRIGETNMPEDHRSFRMEHSIDVDTPQENAFNLINAVEDWADIFPPCQQARVIERDGDWRTIEVTAQVGESVRTWQSRRRLHTAEHKVDFEQQDPFPPIRSMAGYWQVSAVDNASRITLVHEFSTDHQRASEADPPMDLDAAETWIRTICDRNSEKELAAFKEACEAREFAAAS